MAKDLFPSPHPLTPPHHEEERLIWLRLLRSRRVGPATFFRLLKEHGTAELALRALPDVARSAGVKDYEPCPNRAVISELEAGKLAGAKLIAIGEPDYPALLGELVDAPPLIWTLDDTALLSKPMIALVGARNASSLGTRMSRRLSAGLTEAGFVVVSGLARGVDAFYPSENAVLAQEISATGLLLSEQPMGLRPHARHFPQRNRIISGLCQAIVGLDSGGAFRQPDHCKMRA